MNNHKLVLLQLPSPYLLIQKWVLPLQLLYLRSFLRKNMNYEAHIVNLSGLEDWENAIPIDADYYGFTIFTPQVKVAKEVSDFLKKRTTGKIIAGGHHPTMVPVETIENLNIDIIVLGEGEEILKEIIMGRELSEIMGVAYRDKDGQIRINERMPLIKDLDSIPIPEIDGFNLEEYPGMKLLSKGSKYQMGLVTSRGCPYKCSFCDSHDYWRGKVRFHSAQYLIEYFNYLRKFRINNFRFDDDNFALNKWRLEDICEDFVKNKSSWNCLIRSDTVTDDLARLMKQSGCTDVTIGVESGSNKILKIIQKNTTVEKHKEAIEIFKKYGIEVGAFILLGLPEETEETINETFEFVKTQPVDKFNFATFVPFPGCDIYKNPSKYNYTFQTDPYYENYVAQGRDVIMKSISDEGNRVLKLQEKVIDYIKEKSSVKQAFEYADRLKAI